MVNSDLFHFFRNYLSAPGQGPHTEVTLRGDTEMSGNQ